MSSFDLIMGSYLRKSFESEEVIEYTDVPLDDTVYHADVERDLTQAQDAALISNAVDVAVQQFNTDAISTE